MAGRKRQRSVVHQRVLARKQRCANKRPVSTSPEASGASPTLIVVLGLTSSQRLAPALTYCFKQWGYTEICGRTGEQLESTALATATECGEPATAPWYRLRYTVARRRARQVSLVHQWICLDAEAPLEAVLDAAKVADLGLLVYGEGEGLHDVADSWLAAIQAQGLLSFVAVALPRATNTLESLMDADRCDAEHPGVSEHPFRGRAHASSAHAADSSTWLAECHQRLAALSILDAKEEPVRIRVLSHPDEVEHSRRQLEYGKRRAIRWRASRSYLLVERVVSERAPTAPCRRVRLYGWLRGAAASVHQQLHITGVGTFVVAGLERAEAPYARHMAPKGYTDHPASMDISDGAKFAFPTAGNGGLDPVVRIPDGTDAAGLSAFGDDAPERPAFGSSSPMEAAVLSGMQCRQGSVSQTERPRVRCAIHIQNRVETITGTFRSESAWLETSERSQMPSQNGRVPAAGVPLEPSTKNVAVVHDKPPMEAAEDSCMSSGSRSASLASDDDDDDDDSVSDDASDIGTASDASSAPHSRQRATREPLASEKAETSSEETPSLDAIDIQQVERDELLFPDEVDTPTDCPVRERFANYRPLPSFRKTPWDPSVGLPPAYARIVQFEHFQRATREAFQRARDATCHGVVQSHCFVAFVLDAIAEPKARRLESWPGPLVASCLLSYEERPTVLQCLVQRYHVMTNLTSTEDNESPALACPDNGLVHAGRLLCFHIGFRRLLARPIFSEADSKCDKHRYERYLLPGRWSVASLYAPVTFPPAPVLVTRPSHGTGPAGTAATTPVLPALVARGSVLGANPERIVLKRIVLTGVPYRAHKNRATVRYMFFNPEDVKYYRHVPLWTKHGRLGRIEESLGTHGALKASFDGMILHSDTVCMSLYKRVFPRWVPGTSAEELDETGDPRATPLE